jgi:hypothetical protein
MFFVCMDLMLHWQPEKDCHEYSGQWGVRRLARWFRFPGKTAEGQLLKAAATFTP